MVIKVAHIPKEIIEIEIVECICDWCGKHFSKEDLENEAQPYGEVEVRFGWGSRYDGETMIGEICDGCFRKNLEPKLRRK